VNGGSKGAKQPNIGADALHSFQEKIVEDNSGGCHLFILFINSRDEYFNEREIRIRQTEKKSRITFIGGEGVHRESAKQPNIGADTLHSFREKIVEDNSGTPFVYIVYIVYKFARRVIQ